MAIEDKVLEQAVKEFEKYADEIPARTVPDRARAHADRICAGVFRETQEPLAGQATF